MLHDDYDHACAGKHQYRTKQWAKSAMINTDIENKARLRFGVGNYKNMGKLNVYFCKHCGYWHIGHKPEGL